MMKKKIIITVILMCLLFYCCNGNVKKNIGSGESIKLEDSLVKSNTINVNINDTLILGEKNYGEILIIKHLQDSIKRTSNDLRGVTVYLSIYEEEDNFNFKECDTFFQSSLDFIKVPVPFYVIPETSGEKTIKGIVKEKIILDAYKFKDSTQTRLIEFEHFFNKEVYVKGRKGSN